MTPVVSQANLTNLFMDVNKLVGQIRLHEGFKGKTYLDSTGHPTIGIGFNLSRGDAETRLRSVGANYQDVLDGTYTLSREQAEALLKHDLDELESAARKIVFVYDDLDDVRQRVIMDMIFNLGAYGFSQFKDTIRYICRGKYGKAADSMVDSMWAKQTKRRARMLAEMMRYGEDVYDL